MSECNVNKILLFREIISLFLVYLTQDVIDGNDAKTNF